MKIIFRKNYLMVAIILFSFSSLTAQNVNNWNQFRGVNRDGISPEVNLPKKMLDKAPTLLWKKELGEGFSEMVIVGDKLITMSSSKKDSISGNEYLAVYNKETGEEIWKVVVDSIFIDNGGFGDGPRSTPLVEGNVIYSISSWGKMFAHNLSNGKEIWKVDFMSTYGSPVPRWAFSTSPLIIGNSLYVEVGGKGENQGFAAYDKKTGKELWMKGKAVPYYCSPLYTEIDGVKLILFANENNLFAFNEKGDTLWTHTMPIGRPTAMPIVFDGNKIFVSTLHRGYVVVEVNNGVVKQLYKGMNLKNDYSSTIYHDGHFYGFNVATLVCVSAETGKTLWSKRGFGKGSLIMVDGRFLVLSDKGKLIEVKANPKEYQEVGSFQVLKGKSWTAPTFVDGKLYVRNLTEMACYSLY